MNLLYQSKSGSSLVLIFLVHLVLYKGENPLKAGYTLLSPDNNGIENTIRNLREFGEPS